MAYPHCATEGCPCTSTFNGEPGEVCNLQIQCRTCRDGTACAASFHTPPFPGADQHSALPQTQVSRQDRVCQPTDVGRLSSHISQNILDPSHEANMADSDGDLHDPGNSYSYAQHDDSVVLQSEPAALTNTDRTSAGRIAVATVIIYVT